MVAATALICGPATEDLVNTPVSRARPAKLKQSARFGVRSTSMMVSSKLRYSRTSTPNGALSGNSIKPSELSAMPSSCSAHNIPNDSTPRSLAFLILKPPGSSEGSTAPIFANGIFNPSRTLAAPHTIWNVSVPSVTWQRLSLSASGCCSRETT